MLSLVIFWMLANIVAIDGDAKFLKTFVYWLKKPLFSSLSILLTGIVLYAVPIIFDIVISYLPGISASFLGVVSSGVLISVFQWVFLQPIFYLMINNSSNV